MHKKKGKFLGVILGGWGWAQLELTALRLLNGQKQAGPSKDMFDRKT